MTHLHIRKAALFATIATSAVVLTACAAPAPQATDEVAETTASTRIAITYDGGIAIVDAETLDIVGDVPLAGFNRVNPAGDGQHVLVTTAKGFEVLDTASASLTGDVFAATTAGHVVRHGDKTILFDDGTGDTTIFSTDDLLAGGLPETEVVGAEAAHHGVSIELENGTLLTTVGTPDERTGIRVLDASRTEIDRNEECPSVHGEGAAANEIAVFGCSDGVLVYDDGEITKIQAPDAYGRTGNQYVSETSPIAIGDYNSDPDSEGYLLSELAIIDTVAKTSTVVDLPEGVEYTWRDVARGPNDETLLLGSDGALHVLESATGEVTASFPVIEPWESPVEWQDAHPALTVYGGTAYVTDAASASVYAVDIASGDVIATTELPGAPIEIAVAS